MNVNQKEDIPRPLWGIQAENRQEYLKADKQRKKQNKTKLNNKKAQAAATIPAESTYNTIVDMDGPKPQDDTATALQACDWANECVSVHAHAIPDISAGRRSKLLLPLPSSDTW